MVKGFIMIIKSLELDSLPFTPTLTNFASRQAKETGPTENFFRKILILPRKSRFGGASVVQMGKRKMQVFDFQALAFCWVPGAAVEIINLTKIILN